MLGEIYKLRVRSKLQSVIKVCVQCKVSEGAAVEAYIGQNEIYCLHHKNNLCLKKKSGFPQVRNIEMLKVLK